MNMLIDKKLRQGLLQVQEPRHSRMAGFFLLLGSKTPTRCTIMVRAQVYAYAVDAFSIDKLSYRSGFEDDLQDCSDWRAD